MDKHITEIARGICKMSKCHESCEKCEEAYDDIPFPVPCYYRQMAKEIVNNGYRQKSEVIDEFITEFKKSFLCVDTDMSERICEVIENVATRMKGAQDEVSF